MLKDYYKNMFANLINNNFNASNYGLKLEKENNQSNIGYLMFKYFKCQCNVKR